MRHIAVVSDIHLCTLDPTSDLWMRYRQASRNPDIYLRPMLDALATHIHTLCETSSENHELTLIFNGDTFDFDAPIVAHGKSRHHDEPRTREHSIQLLNAILDDHPQWLEGTAQLIADGHTIVFIAGNHDAQLSIPGVWEILKSRILSIAHMLSPNSGDMEGRLQFRTWFYTTPDGIHIEHGHQYDPYCSFHYPTAPFHKHTSTVQPTLGSLGARLLTSRMGYFNPHVDESHERTAASYVQHWIRYYIGSHHSLLFSWLFGSIQAFFHLVGAVDHGDEARYQQFLQAASRETGMPLHILAQHSRLFSKPIEISERIRMARELWIDRVAWFFFSLLWAVAIVLLLPWPTELLGALSFAVFALYEIVTPKWPAAYRWNAVSEKSPNVAAIYNAKAIVFGHTHHPFAHIDNGIFVANSGSLSSMYFDEECMQPVFPQKPLVWIQIDNNHALSGKLMGFDGQHFAEFSQDRLKRLPSAHSHYQQQRKPS